VTFSTVPRIGSLGNICSALLAVSCSCCTSYWYDVSFSSFDKYKVYAEFQYLIVMYFEGMAVDV